MAKTNLKEMVLWELFKEEAKKNKKKDKKKVSKKK